jgi:hypothetical protein
MGENDRKQGFWLMLATDPVLWFVLASAVLGPAALRIYTPAIVLLFFVTMALAIWWVVRKSRQSQ